MDVHQKYAQNILSDRRIRSELDRDRRVEAYHARYPQLLNYDREIRIARAELLLAMADDPLKARDRAAIEAILDKRASFLKEQGIPDDFDQIVPFCRLCNDTGFIDQNPCECFKELMIPMLLETSGLLIKDEKTGNFKEKFPNWDFHHHNSELFSRPDRANRIKDMSLAFSRAIPEKPGNLLFWGNPGTGKTYMAVCITRAAVLRGVPAIILRIADILDIFSMYRNLMNSYSPDQERLSYLTEIRGQILQSELLVIDDFGTEARGPNTISDLLNIFGTRKSSELSTIITTNLSPTDIQNKYDNRLYSRLFGDFDSFRFEGSDLRINKKL
jgi:DNA replication protein DnaC